MTLVRYNLRSLYKNIWSTKLDKEAIQKQGKLRTFALFKGRIYMQWTANNQKTLKWLFAVDCK